MYRYELYFVLIGVDKVFAEVLQSLKPLAGFTHKTEEFDDVSEIEGKRNEINAVVFVSGKDAKKAREKFSDKARFIIISDGKVNSLNLSLQDDIWTLPLSKDALQFKFKKLLADIKNEKDFYFSEQYFETLISAIPDLVWVKNIDGRHLNVNQAFCEAVGKERDDVRGKYHGYIWGRGGKEEREGERICRESEMAIIKARKSLMSNEVIKHYKRGHRELNIIKSPVFDEYDNIVGTIGFAHDVTKEKEVQKDLLQLAYTDALTGLSNRRYFYQSIEENRGAQGLTICYIDLDHFKQLNDTYGHNAGDGAILGVAELLRVVFANDYTTRMGGDEFAVGIVGNPTKAEINKRIVYLERKGKEMFESEISMQNLSMSIGISSVGSDKSLEMLLLEGDNALYFSKAHGRARHTFYDDMPR